MLPSCKIPVSSKRKCTTQVSLLDITRTAYATHSRIQFIHYRYVGRTCITKGPSFTSINKHVMHSRLPCDFNFYLSIAKSTHPSLVCKYKHRLLRKYHSVKENKMVHGTGSFGGGGGFSGGSGGGFSTTIMAHNYSHSYRRHGHGDDCDCSWICICFCCRGQSFKVRILTLWTWLIAIVLTTSLVTLFHVNKAQTIEATVTDMRKVPKTPSESFCSGVTITSDVSSFTAFLIDGEPVVSRSDVQNVTFRKNTNIAYNKYEYWGFYLLKNSIIEISSCPDSILEFMIVRGEESFNRFKNEECMYSCSVFDRSSSCFFNRPDRFHFKVPGDDEYYLIYASRYITPFPTNLAVNFTLEKRLYDLQNSVSECSNSHGSPQCTLPFPSMHSHPSIVLNVTSSSDLEGDAVIKVACVSKDWVYVMLFFILPAVIGALGTLLIVKKYRKKPAVTSTQSSAPFTPLPPVLEQSQRVESGQHESGYGTIMAPPKYENTIGKLPTYEEATRK